MKKSQNQRGLVPVLVLIVITVTILGGIRYLSDKPNIQVEEKPDPKYSHLSDIVEIYNSNIKWKEAVSSDLPKNWKHQLMICDGECGDSDKIFNIPIISGRTYTSIYTKEELQGNPVINDQQFTKSGWQYEFVYDQKNLSSGGPFDNSALSTRAQNSFIRQNGNSVQILHTYEEKLDTKFIDPTDPKDDMGTMIETAPYRVKEIVFISDWFSITELIAEFNKVYK